MLGLVWGGVPRELGGTRAHPAAVGLTCAITFALLATESAGVTPNNSAYPAFARALGAEPAANLTFRTEMANASFVKAWFDLLDAQTGGQNYWWLDNGMPRCQPDGGPPCNSTLSSLSLEQFNAILFDRIAFFEDAAARGKLGRPTVMGPFGGLGTHRYPFVHSGDVLTEWSALEFEAYYTATASNALISFVAHDVGGHRDTDEFGNDPELITRWVQYGAFSAQLRPHPQIFPAGGGHPKDWTIERRPWMFDHAHFAAMRSTMQLRARLVPYIYSAALAAYLSGVPFLRALYVDWPTELSAYSRQARAQFLFGDALLVAPITSPMNRSINVSLHSVWLPPLPPTSTSRPTPPTTPGGVTGRFPISTKASWVALDTGACYAGGDDFLQLNFTLYERPVFVKGGSIIPMSRLPSRRWEEHYFTGAGATAALWRELPPPLLGAAHIPQVMGPRSMHARVAAP